MYVCSYTALEEFSFIGVCSIYTVCNRSLNKYYFLHMCMRLFIPTPIANWSVGAGHLRHIHHSSFKLPLTL